MFHEPIRFVRRAGVFVVTLLAIDLLDEFVFGAGEAAWPLIRDDLALSYAQIGVALAAPGVVSSVVEPVLGILGDVWRRRLLILGGGVAFSLALLLTALSHGFATLLVAFALMYPASGAFVSLSQATLIPLGLGLAAERFGLAVTMWLLLLGPLALVAGIPRRQAESEQA